MFLNIFFKKLIIIYNIPYNSISPMVTAYFIGYLPDKERTKVLIEIENSTDSQNNFNREVIDKDNAQYETDKFKIIKIIDEWCNEYTHVYLTPYASKLCELNQEIFDPLNKCYLTKKRVFSMKHITNNKLKDYYKNGQICIKIYYTSYQQKIKEKNYYENGKIKEIINYVPFSLARNGEYRKWNNKGLLIQHTIHKDNVIITDLLYDYWNDLINKDLEKQFEYSEETKDDFTGNIKKLLDNTNYANDSINKIKFVKLLFKYLNSSIGIKYLKEYSKFKKVVIDKIEELTKNKVIIKTLKYGKDDDKIIANDVLESMKIIKNIIDETN